MLARSYRQVADLVVRAHALVHYRRYELGAERLLSHARQLAKNETAVHAAADAYKDRIKVVVKHAFALGKKHLPHADQVAEAIGAELKKSLPRVLLQTMKAGGDAALSMLPSVSLRAAGDLPGHEFHGNQWTDAGGGAQQVSVDVHSVGNVQTYHLSREASALHEDKDYVWETDLLPALDGLRPAGISDTENARKSGAAKKLNQLAEKHGVTKGFAVEIISKQSGRVGIATVARGKVNDKDYPDFLKAAADYMGGQGLSTAQEKTMGKWLGFSSKSTKQYLTNKAKWGNRSAEDHRFLRHELVMKFDATNQDAIDWADEHAAELVTGISETTRDRIREAITLQEASGEDATDRIAAVVGDDRAEVIARTESMTAANEGQRQSWDQAVDAGLLPQDATRVWIAAADPCPECEDLDGEEVGLDEDYPNDGGDGPPLHPNCRCTEGIVAA